MPASARRAIVFFCLALILLAALTPGAWFPPVVLVPVGFVLAALIVAPIVNRTRDRKPPRFPVLAIHSPRPPPVG